MPDPANDNDIDALLRHLDNGYWPQKHAALSALVAERDALRKERQMYWKSCDALEKQNLDLRKRVEELRTKEDSWKSARKMALDDIDKADAERVAELEAQSPATSDLRERDEAMTLWMDQVTAMLCHSMTHSHDAKQTLVTRCDTAIAAMRKGGGA